MAWSRASCARVISLRRAASSVIEGTWKAGSVSSIQRVEYGGRRGS